MMDEPVRLGTRRELFVDDWLLAERSEALTFQLHAPTPREIALVTDQPWEGNSCGYIAVIPGDNTDASARMYYKTQDCDWRQTPGDDGNNRDGFPQQDTHPIGVACAESNDGIHWQKPSLNAVTFNGSGANNLVWLAPSASFDDVGQFCPFRDTHPQCSDAARYKALGNPRLATKARRLFPMQSPDGLHWSKMRDEPCMAEYKFDSPNTAFYDAQLGAYRAYFRHGGPHGRAIFTATSPDFLNWTEGRILEYPGAAPMQLYTNSIQPYPRAPHIYVGFPTRYVPRDAYDATIEALPQKELRRELSNNTPRLGTALTDGLFMSSRDGETWQRWDEAFLRPGPQQDGNWIYGDHFQSWGMLETPSARDGAPSELSFYATERYRHDSGVRFRRFSLRLDGFVSLNAPYRGGAFTTRPLLFSGDRLMLNMATSAAGGLRVGLLDEHGQSIDGFSLDDCDEVVGDETDRMVTWRGSGDLSALAGAPIRLHVTLWDADLYALRFAGADDLP